MARRLLVLALVMGLMTATVALPAQAAKKKKKKAVATTLYLHGTQPAGELESFAGTSDVNTYLPMDTNEPAGGPRSKQLLNYVRGPNTQCAGNNLFPVWTGQFVGKVTGTVKVSFQVVSTGGQVDVRVWPDVVGQACTNETLGVFEYIEPAVSRTADLPVGQGIVEVELQGANFTATHSLMLQLTPVVETPFFGRVLYDVEESKMELTCIPSSGSACA